MTQTMTRSITAVVAFTVATSMVFAFAASASAFGGFHRGGGDETRVSSSNTAHVTNTATTRANTGRNDADGGDGDDGGDSGNARGGDATTGRGGNGGHGGDAGTIRTGAATSFGTIFNDINRNNTVIDDDCGCFGQILRHGRGNDDNTMVRNINRARVNNTQTTSANTGHNVADGGEGGEGGDSGNATKRTRHHRHHFLGWLGGHGDASTGNGGHGGNGGAGGSITTGEAYAEGYIENVVNRNTTRIERGGASLAI